MKLTPEQIERNREFLKDLRANEKKAKGKMRDTEGGRCCLCVAYDTAQRLGANLPPPLRGNDEDEVCDATMPPEEMAKFYGWEDRNPILGESRAVRERASLYNDGVLGVPEKTHPEIADLFEETYRELKVS